MELSNLIDLNMHEGSLDMDNHGTLDAHVEGSAPERFEASLMPSRAPRSGPIT